MEYFVCSSFITGGRRLDNTSQLVERQNRLNLSFGISSNGGFKPMSGEHLQILPNEQPRSEIVFPILVCYFCFRIIDYNNCIESQWVCVTFYVLLVFDTLNKVFPMQIQDTHEILAGFLIIIAKVHLFSSSLVLLWICRRPVRYGISLYS